MKITSKDFKINSEIEGGTNQNAYVTFQGEEYVFKKPNKNIPADKHSLRIINEVIWGTFAAMTSSNVVSKKYHFVYSEDGHLEGLLCSKIKDLESAEDFSTGLSGLKKMLESGIFGEAIAFDFFAENVDGCNNIGYSQGKLAIFDPGLANYLYLLASGGALLRDETRRLPRLPFNLNEKTFLDLLFTPYPDCEKFLTHHLFSDFVKNLRKLPGDLAQKLFAQVYAGTVKISNAAKAIKDEVDKALSSENLNEEDKAIFAELVSNLTAKGVLFSKLLATISQESYLGHCNKKLQQPTEESKEELSNPNSTQQMLTFLNAGTLVPKSNTQEAAEEKEEEVKEDEEDLEQTPPGPSPTPGACEINFSQDPNCFISLTTMPAPDSLEEQASAAASPSMLSASPSMFELSDESFSVTPVSELSDQATQVPEDNEADAGYEPESELPSPKTPPPRPM